MSNVAAVALARVATMKPVYRTRLAEVNKGKPSDGVDLLAEPLAWLSWAAWW